MPKGLNEIGVTGLKRYGRFSQVNEEFLTELSGSLGVRTYREMRDNDAVIGSVMLALEQTMMSVDWEVEKGGEKENKFVKGCLHDMAESWSDTLTNIMSMLTFGWALFEPVYKLRRGPKAGRASRYNDGCIGWHKFALRAQDTLFDWKFAENGDVESFRQQAPPTFRLIEIPMNRCLLFRTTSYKDSPEGRALDPETMIPTPDGWKKLDDIKVGDKVFDETGKVRYVIARKDWNDRPCYKVIFGDNSEIIADENHLWVTQLLHERSTGAFPKIRTTQTISDTVKNSSGVSNHSIPWARALDYPVQILPLHPYYLGLWLGDGFSNSSALSCHVQDADQTCRLLESCGYKPFVVRNGKIEGNGRIVRVEGDTKRDSKGPQSLLRALGLIGNKHIPESYLRGSIMQRTALLAGLMDSDGTIDNWGRCEFGNTNMNLISGVKELVNSLGCGAVARLRHKANGTSHKLDCWTVKFTMTDWLPFMLERKLRKVKLVRARKNHYIVDVEPVSSRRTVCIEVDSPSHLFLAGEAMVPTHNSLLRNSFRAWYFKKQLEEVEGIGIERDLTGMPVIYYPKNVDLSKEENSGRRTHYLNMLRAIAVDEQYGMALPDDHKFELVSSPGTKAISTDDVIHRYDTRIAMTLLGQFIMLGTRRVGSYAMAKDHRDLFNLAVDGWLGRIVDVMNTFAIPRLLRYNGMDEMQAPMLKFVSTRVDPERLASFLQRLSAAEPILKKHPGLEDMLLRYIRFSDDKNLEEQTL